MVSRQCTSDSRLMVGVNFGIPQRSHHKMSSQNLRLQIPMFKVLQFANSSMDGETQPFRLFYMEPKENC